MSDIELPTPKCWRCGALCNIEYVDITSFAFGPELIRGRVTCPNRECVGSVDPCADLPPSPQQLLEAGQRALDTVRGITLETLL